MLVRETPEATIEEEFWSNTLSGVSLPLIIGKSVPAAVQEIHSSDEDRDAQDTTFETTTLSEISEQVSSTFYQEFAIDMQRNSDIAIEHLLFGCLLVLIYRYTGETDFTLGFSQQNANALPVRVLLEKDALTFQQIVTTAIKSIHASAKHPLSAAKIRSLLPDYIQDALHSSEYPFDIALHVHSESSKPTKAFKPGLFAFEVILSADGGAVCTLHYVSSKYDFEFVESLLRQFQIIVRTALKNRTCVPTDFQIASAQDVASADAYNDTDIAPVYPNMGVSDVLRLIASQFPDQDAIIFQPENRDLSQPDRMTYRQLDARVTALAYYLRHIAKLQNGERIGISLSRSPELFVAILAVMRAGLVVVTLGSDKNIRVRNLYKYKADNTNIALFLTDDETKELLDYKDKDTLLDISAPAFQEQLNEIQRRLLSVDETDKLTFQAPAFDPLRTLYIMYTSGSSTGIPSGIEISEYGYMNLLNHHASKNTPKHKAEISISKDDADALFYQIAKWLALQLWIVTTTNSACMDVAFVAALMKEHEVYYADLLANFLRKLLEFDLRSLGEVISMGESSEANTFTHVNKNYPATKINEGYGPTECTICTSDDSAGNFGLPGILGKPIANTKMYVLTGYGNDFALSPYYVPGEIVIFGPSVGKGYLDKSQNEGRFVFLKRTSPQQFSVCEPHEQGALRCYLTGDYGRFVRAPDGNTGIQFLCRKDEIIKINGITVNLVGTRNLILNHPEIQKLVKELVLVPIRDKHNNNLITSLVGLILMHDEYNAATDEDLNLTLREYMEDMPLQPIAIPRFTSVAQIPLTPTGKINSKELEAYAAELLEAEETAMLHPDGAKDPNILFFLTKLCASILSQKEELIDTKVSFANLGINSKQITLMMGTINRVLKLSKYKKYELRYGMGPENIKEENTTKDQHAAVTIEQLTDVLTRRIALIKQHTIQEDPIDLNLRVSGVMQMLSFGNHLQQQPAEDLPIPVEKLPLQQIKK